MLHLRRLSTRSAIHSLMASFDPKQSSWVVSDLRSKFELQQILLERDGGYLDSSVLRASDLWKTLLKRCRPEIRIVSRDFIRSMVRSFLAKHQSALGKGIAAERSVLEAMDRFAAVVFHPRGQELMNEWFEENPDAKERWGENYLMARVLLRSLKEQNLMTAKWVAAVLQAEENFERYWTTPLLVDLGAELTGAEAQLLLRISKNCEVTFLEPAPAWRSEAESVLRPYTDILGAATSVQTVSAVTESPSDGQALRYSGQLAECKAAVAFVRDWVSQGMRPDEIAVLAPEIEDYWPVLSAIFHEEGLPVDKALTLKLNALPSISRWLARLRARRGEPQSADVELTFFSSELSQRIRHEEFRALFANIYGEEDLDRHALVHQVWTRGPRFSESMKRDDFMMSSALLWDADDEAEALLQIFREILQNAVETTELSLVEWIRYVESIAASREKTLTAAVSGGVLVANLASSRTTRLRRRIFLGLTEEGLRKADFSPLPLADIAKLSDLGFYMEHPDQSSLEFELRWLAESPSARDLFMMGTTTFEGAVRAPSGYWLRRHREFARTEDGEKLAVPGLTRWDLLQQASDEVGPTVRGWRLGRGIRLKERLQQDLGDLPFENVKDSGLTSLSPSFVKKYLDCPFQAAASKVFCLKDLEEMDLDLARSGLGTLSHALFQRLTDEDWISEGEVSEERIASLINELRAQLKLQLAEERWWPSLLKRQIRVVREFLRVEKDWKAQFPQLHLLPSEAEWKIYFDSKEGTFSTRPGEGRLCIEGRIDRLETDRKGHYVVVDYKASAAGLTDQADWIKKNDLQLLFYMWAVEKGAVAGLSGEVIGAFYYVYKDFSRNRGLQLGENAGVLYPASIRRSKKEADDDVKRRLFLELEEKITFVVAQAREGNWAPRPREKQVCEKCRWVDLCRAPHLN